MAQNLSMVFHYLHNFPNHDFWEVPTKSSLVNAVHYISPAGRALMQSTFCRLWEVLQ